jgi:hypothetical protein
MLGGMREGERKRWGIGLGLAASLVLIAAVARAAFPVFGPNDVKTVFFISKSDDKNRVDYWMRLDATCSAVDDDAIVPYWHEFEPPPPERTKPLSMFAKMGYGVATQKLVKRSPAGGDYVVRLKQVDRSIGVATKRGSDGRCIATTRMTIGGVTAELLSVHVKLSGPLSVEYIDIKGRDPRTGKPAVERLKR